MGFRFEGVRLLLGFPLLAVKGTRLRGFGVSELQSFRNVKMWEFPKIGDPNIVP